MLNRVLRLLVHKEEREFLAAVTVCLTTPRDLFQRARHHAKHLVANIVPIAIVALLEVIDIDHYNRVQSLEPIERFVESLAGE